MAKRYKTLTPELAAWIARQRLFFVASAPLSAGGHINLSPKGGDSFRILGPGEVVYQDYTGSGVETIAHLQENGRIVLMFCAFGGAPKIVRLHGQGAVVTSDDARFAELAHHFPTHPGTRAFIQVKITRISDSCGYSVPLFDFRGPRDALDRWVESQGPQKLREYRAAKNRKSIDDLPALPSDPSARL